MPHTMTEALTLTGAFGVSASLSTNDLTLDTTELRFKGAAASATAFASSEEGARCLAETLDFWWNTTLPLSTDYDAAKLTNYKTAVSNYAVSSATKLTRRYTQDIYYTIGNLESAVDTGT